jgi:hypothetical protein
LVTGMLRHGLVTGMLRHELVTGMQRHGRGWEQAGGRAIL